MGNRIKELPIFERPYEKMILYGEQSLSNSELLSIIIRTGTKKNTSIEIAQNIININSSTSNDLRFLQDLSIEELIKIDGIGKIKAIELKAIGEITKRMSKPINNKKLCIKTKLDIANLFMEELRYEKNEILKVVLLNNKNIIQKIVDVAMGKDDRIIFDIKQILSEPIKMQSPRIILVHNHPSGNSVPSKEDIEISKKIFECSGMMGIQLLDHIIIGDGNYQSALE